MDSLEAELERARALDVDELADAIESIGFECTRCGGCCTGEDEDAHTATVFPDEVRELQASEDYDWRDVARPMPYGLEDVEADDADADEAGDAAASDTNDAAASDTNDAAASDTNDAAATDTNALQGTTFEWALQTDACGDCAFYEERPDDGTEDDTDDAGPGYCTVHEDRPLICQTYPFSVALGGTTQPMGEAVDEEGIVRAHECEGLGREIDREDAEELAGALKARAIRELEEAIGVREQYEHVEPGDGEVVVHDSEGAKDVDGRPIDPSSR